MKHGKGKLTFSNGTSYEGDFRQNNFEGFGTSVTKNHKYVGSWKNGKMEGAGKSEWYNDAEELMESYEGQYKNGLKHGQGEYRWGNDRSYSGNWEYGEIKPEPSRKKASGGEKANFLVKKP